MTQENGRSLPVLCRVLSQNHTRVFLVEEEEREKGDGERETKKRGGGWGEKKGRKDEEDIHMHVLHAYTNPINVFV